MKIRFLYQGAEGCKESVGSSLLESLANTEFEQFKCLSAFASPKGINGLKDAIIKSKEHIQQFSVIVGINQNNTSKEALEAVVNWNVGASIYYTRSQITFHPKVYIFEGKNKKQIIVGSSNLTKQGLFQNVEASLIVDFNKPDVEGEKLLQEINSYLEPFFNGKIANVQKLTPELIQQLLDSNLIPTEAEKKKLKEYRTATKKEKQETDKMDNIKALFPTITIQTLPDGFKLEKGVIGEKSIVETKPHKIVLVPFMKPAVPMVSTVPVKTTLVSQQDPWAIRGKLLWKKVLTLRDLQIVSERTAPSGVISLTQAQFKVNGKLINFKTYFRNEVFGSFNWERDRASSEAVATKVKFLVKIMGKDIGQYELTLRHNPKWESGENNYTTGLSWGIITKEIKNPNLIGKILCLYAPANGQKEPFYIEIKDSNNMAKWFNK
jgi:HKD family nuclease